MKRDYRIAHYPESNERAIMRVNEDDKRWLAPEWVRTKKEARAKRYFHEDSAISTLTKIKFKWDLEEEKPYRPEVAAQSWHEL